MRKQIQITCAYCSKSAHKDLSEVTRTHKKGNKIYCSRKCSNLSKITHKKVFCAQCQKEIIKQNKDIKRSKNSFCSSSCCTTFNNLKRDYSLTVWDESARNKARINTLKKYEEQIKIYLKTPNKCSVCKSELPFKKRKNTYCSFKCKNPIKPIKDLSLIEYRNKCKFNFGLSTFPNEFDFSLIKKYGWYSPSNKKNNLQGVSRDHMYSVKEGFLNNINPEYLKHPANCQLLQHSHNISKNYRSVIHLEELLERIEIWDLLYKP